MSRERRKPEGRYGLDRFRLTEQHLALLRQAHVRWGSVEFGAPEIDGKRPYGNSSVYDDIADILGLPTPDPHDDDQEFSDELIATMNRLHKETETALQIVLATGSFVPGEYVADKYSRNWWLESDL